MYRELQAKGYNYAGWALSVATGDSLTGEYALSFLERTAMLGWGGDACRNLSHAQIDAIKEEVLRVEAIVDQDRSYLHLLG